MPNYATQRFRYAQWTGDNAEDVADVFASVSTETITGTSVIEGGVLLIHREWSMDLAVQPDNYVVASLGYLNQEVTPVQFAEWFIV